MRNSRKARLTAAGRWAVTAAFLLPVAAIGPAKGQDTTERCSPLYRNAVDRQASAGLSAHIYSRENVGAVGISIYPGRTLSQDSAHALGVKIVTALEQNGVGARCFVHYENGTKGSGFDYKITGLSWSDDGPLNIVEATSPETLRGVIAEAKTARALLASD